MAFPHIEAAVDRQPFGQKVLTLKKLPSKL